MLTLRFVAADEDRAGAARCAATGMFGWGRLRGGSRFRRRLLDPAWEIALGNLDRLKHCFDFRAALFEPRRKEKALAELVSRFIHGESIGHRGGTFNQNSARAAAIDRLEIHAVFYFRTIGVTQLVINTLLLGELLVIFNFEGHVMRRAGSEDPTAGRTIGLVEEGDRLGGTAFSNFEAVIGALLAGFAETESVNEKALGFGDFANGKHRAMETARGYVTADFLGGPVLARVSAILEHFELDARRMIKADEFLSEPFLNTAVLHFVAVQVFQPEFQRAFRDRVCGSLNLTGTLAAFHASIRKGGVNRARLGIRIGIIKMIVGIAAIEENSLLDHALAKNLCLEVDI